MKAPTRRQPLPCSSRQNVSFRRLLAAFLWYCSVKRMHYSSRNPFLCVENAYLLRLIQIILENRVRRRQFGFEDGAGKGNDVIIYLPQHAQQNLSKTREGVSVGSKNSMSCAAAPFNFMVCIAEGDFRVCLDTI